MITIVAGTYSIRTSYSTVLTSLCTCMCVHMDLCMCTYVVHSYNNYYDLQHYVTYTYVEHYVNLSKNVH